MTQPATLQDINAFPPLAVLNANVHRVLGMNPSAFTGPGTNTYLVGQAGSNPVLIDSGIGVPVWQKNLQTHTQQQKHAPQRCLFTHGHPDHIGGWQQLRALWPNIPFYKMPWPQKDGALTPQLTPIQDGNVFEGEGYTLRAVHTPGHAPDHICFWLEEEKALFTGDVVLGIGTTVIPQDGGNMKQYLGSLQRLLEMKPERIYPGHGPVIENACATITNLINHRLQREEQVLNCVGDGLESVEEIVALLYQKYPKNLHHAAGQSVLSHLDKLVEDGRVVRTGMPPRFGLL